MMNTPIQLGNWWLDLSNVWMIGIAVTLILAVPFVLMAVWRRLYQRNPGRAFAAVTLNLITAFVLLLLLTQPVREHLTTRDVVLISEGATSAELSALVKDDTYIMPDALEEEQDQRSMLNANWLSNAGQLAIREPALAKVEVRGFGLSTTQWTDIPFDVEIGFTPPAVQGFYAMQWPRILVMGDSLHISGRFNANEKETIVELRLLDPADKAIAKQRLLSGGHFSLLARPKSPGNLIYRLQAWSGEDLLADETVAIFIGDSEPQRILVEQSAPSYETLQLKNFASDLGATLILNSRISKGKAISQAVNLAEDGESGFTPANLADSDWLIMDGRGLLQLQAQQNQWLVEAVRQGLGVLVLADESLLDESAFDSISLLNGFVLTGNPEAETDLIPQIKSVPASENELSLPTAAMTLSAAENSASGINTIITSSSGKLLVASHQLDSGRVAISLINQSHQWLTAGQRVAWSNYWLAISTAISRQTRQSFLLPPSADNFNRLNQRLQACAFGGIGELFIEIPTAPLNSEDVPIQSSIELPLTTDTRGSARKCAWYWPDYPGWQQLSLLDKTSDSVVDSQSIYVYPADQWTGQRQYENVSATLNRRAQNQPRNNDSKAQKMVSEPLDPFWLWVIFVVATSLLWLERKLDWDA